MLTTFKLSEYKITSSSIGPCNGSNLLFDVAILLDKKSLFTCFSSSNQLDLLEVNISLSSS
jgi:hypothetical protein